MRKLWILWKINFRSMLRTLSVGRGSKAVGGFAALGLMAFLALYCSGVYSFLLADVFAQAGLMDLLAPLMAVLACVMALVLTLGAATGFVFGGRDADLMLTLPVPASTVVLGKLLALYLENLTFCGLWMLPVTLAYVLKAPGGAAQSAAYCAYMLLALPFLPLLPTTLALLCGWASAYVSGHAGNKSLVQTIVGFALLIAVMLGSFQINRLIEHILLNAGAVRHALHTALLPFGLLLDALAGSVPALAGFALCCTAPFLLLAFCIGTRYQRILSALKSHRTRSDYRLRDVRAGSAFAALFKKECRRFFGTPVYLLNMGFGAVMLIGFSAYAVLRRGEAARVLDVIGGAQAAAPLFMLVAGLLASTCNTACVSLSLEGKTLWILKEAPVRAQTLFGAKALLGLLAAALPAALSVLLLTAAFGVPAFDALAMLALCVSFGAFLAAYGLTVNLHFPKLDSENEAVVVKQSASTLLGIFGGMLAAGLCALAWGLLSARLAFPVFCLLLSALLLAAAALLWRRICRRGPALLTAL